MNGKVHRRIIPQQNEPMQLNGLGELPPGMYILRSESCSGRIHHEKLIKQL